MFKLIGACMTLAACGNMGLTWARTFEKRPRQLAAMEAALQLLETEIIYGATPLPEAMEQVAEKSDTEIEGLFRLTAGELRKMEGVTAAEAWGKALQVFSQETSMTQQDLHILDRLGTSLGVSDREDQAKHLKLARSQVKVAITQAETASRKNVTVYRYMGFLGGLLLVLLLY